MGDKERLDELKRQKAKIDYQIRALTKDGIIRGGARAAKNPGGWALYIRPGIGVQYGTWRHICGGHKTRNDVARQIGAIIADLEKLHDALVLGEEE